MPMTQFCYLIIVVCGVFIIFNWLSLVSFFLKGSEGGFSFCPPYFCGILAAIASFGAFEQHAVWLAILFFMIDPSIGFILVMIIRDKWFR